MKRWFAVTMASVGVVVVVQLGMALLQIFLISLHIISVDWDFRWWYGWMGGMAYMATSWFMKDLIPEEESVEEEESEEQE